MIKVIVEIEGKGEVVGVNLRMESHNETPIEMAHSIAVNQAITDKMDDLARKCSKAYSASGESAKALNRSFKKGLKDENI